MPWDTTHLGKFIAFVPRVPPDDILLRVFALAGLNKGSTFRATNVDIFSFFKKQKELHPDVLDTISFNNDPDFPYSDQLADALAALYASETMYVAFDNTWEFNSNLNYFRVADYEDKAVYQEIAKAFLKEFKCENLLECAQEMVQ